jgi:hypothetical protein
MTATGLEVFDKTQTTNIWLDEIMAELGPDRQVAWKVLSVVLHKLRDRILTGLSTHLGAELPLLVRGVYYDQFEPSKQPRVWVPDVPIELLPVRAASRAGYLISIIRSREVYHRRHCSTRLLHRQSGVAAPGCCRTRTG